MALNSDASLLDHLLADEPSPVIHPSTSVPAVRRRTLEIKTALVDVFRANGAELDEVRRGVMAPGIELIVEYQGDLDILAKNVRDEVMAQLDPRDYYFVLQRRTGPKRARSGDISLIQRRQPPTDH